jgi:hypothetical protein
MITRARWLLLFLAVATGLGCADDVLAGADLAALGRLAAEVSIDRMVEDDVALMGAHEGDQSFPCGELGPNAWTLSCSLTNQASWRVVEQRLRDAGLEPRLHRTEDGALSTVNVLCDLPGVERPDEVVLVGAHHDAFYSGVDDNGSGTAAVIELGRVLSRYRFARTIRLAVFDLEELGLIGSARYVDSIPPSETIVIAVALDAIAYARHEPGSQQSPFGFALPDVGDFIGMITNDDTTDRATEMFALNQRLELVRLEGAVGPSTPSALTLDLLRADHAPFWLAGMPAMLLTDTGNFRNPYYHTPSEWLGMMDLGLWGGTARLAAVAVAFWARGPR